MAGQGAGVANEPGMSAAHDLTVAQQAPQAATKRLEDGRAGRAPAVDGFWRRFRRSRSGMTGLVIVAAFALAALFAPWLALRDPVEGDIVASLQPPSADAPFGTDALGRDIFSRVVYGARLSLLVSLASVALGIVVAVPMGLAAGYAGGKMDTVVRSLADLLLAFPPFLLALSLVAVIGVGLQNVIISVGITTMPMYIRLVRAEVMRVKQRDYVTAAYALGQRPVAIIVRHILPNVASLVLVQSTLYMGVALLYSAGLGFLGLGVQPPTPEWGAMLGSGRDYIYSAPHLTLFPGLAIFLSVLGFNLLGDGLRDTLDPQLKGR